MRDALYIWHDVSRRALVLSGVEFRDFVPLIEHGVLLLKSRFFKAPIQRAGLEVVPADGLQDIVDDNPYDYGDLVWCDLGRRATATDIHDDDLASLLFYAHRGRTLRSARHDSVGNRVLVHGHDDGWRTLVHFDRWQDASPYIEAWLRQMGLDDLQRTEAADVIRQGRKAVLCRQGTFEPVEGTVDVDALL